MKIAHINEFAGVAWRLAEAQRRLGHEATVFSLQESPYRYPQDVRIAGAEGPLGWNAAMFAHWRTFAAFDVVHVHGGLWRSQVFYPLFKRRYPWKILAAHFHGSETRSGKGLHHLRSPDVLFHSTPDLAPRLPRSIWIPNPIDLPEAPPEPDNPVPRFGHFVSSPLQKGTEDVIRVFREAFGPVDRLQEGGIDKLRGKEAELWVVSGVPHEDALRIMASCDAVIDQYSTYGIYGMVAIEAMAYGKPVFGTPRMDWYPDCPILLLDRPEGTERLRSIARDAGLRRERGRAGRTYVEHVHASEKVARIVLKAYYAADERPTLRTREAVSYWRGRGTTYARERSTPDILRQRAAQVESIIELLRQLELRSVVEIGCGYGRLGREVVRSVEASWVGVDLSRGQLMEARRQSETLRPLLVEASASALPFRDGTFDVVVAVELLMHVPPGRIAAVLRELWRVSRGSVMHADWYEDYLVGFGSGWNWIHDYTALWTALGATTTVRRMKSGGLQRLFLARKA